MENNNTDANVETNPVQDSTEAKPAQETETSEPAEQKVEQPNPDVEALAKQLKAAEEVIQKTKSENAKLKNEKRQQLSAEEQLAEKAKELEAEKAELRVMKNTATAKSLLAELNLSEKEMSDEDLANFISDDESVTVARSLWLKTTIIAERAKAAKAEREKLIKEMPKPPAGDKPENDDLFLQGFNSDYGRYGAAKKR